MPADPRILIVDDSAAIRKSVKNLLTPLKAHISESVNGLKGLEMASGGTFDLIISDVDMPLMDGIEMCRRLKESPSTRGVPLILVSSFDSDSDIEKGFQAGASAYIAKEDGKERLYQEVVGYLSKTAFNREKYVLVVDDSPIILQVVKHGLEQNGFQVKTAENGAAAFDLAKDKRPDLIVTDIEMPRMDGFSLCKAVCADPELSSVPIVVMSTRNEVAYTKRMIQYGAAAYISKPFNMDQLMILIDRILSDQFRLLRTEKERLDSERNLMIASIASLATALEARDAYTRGHSEAVSDIVTGMLARIGSDPGDIERARIGSKLHDIGKIGIRDSVLLKPGPLTDQEFDHIRQHPLIGATILKSIPSLSDILPIVMYHHERVDGKGYPDGLRGEKIPLWARMTAVADTYNALTSDRPYRRGMPQEKALQIIAEATGTQLCPECVSVFLDLMAQSKTANPMLPGARSIR